MTSLATSISTSTPPASTVASFAALGLIDQLQRAVADAGYAEADADPGAGDPAPARGPRPARLRADRHRQDGGVRAADPAPPGAHCRAGRGGGPRVLVLTPTRELATQIARDFADYGATSRRKCAVVFGGVGQGPQVQALRRNVDIVVATPGRLLDLMEQGHVHFDVCEVLVLDEADRMLDMGFIDPIRRIIAALPRKRQNLLFSATMPPEIAQLARPHPGRSGQASPSRRWPPPSSRSTSGFCTSSAATSARCCARSCSDPAMTRVLVFTRTKHGANRVAEQLDRNGVRAEAIHGNKSQSARQRALDAFKRGTHPRAGRDRHRRARHRRRRDHPRHQLRAARRARELRPPHRPHRARRRVRASRCRSATPRSATTCATSSG